MSLLRVACARGITRCNALASWRSAVSQPSVNQRERGASSDLPWKEANVAGKFALKKSSDGQFRFHLKAGNGHIILTSERYQAKGSAHNGIQSVQTNAALDERFERRTSHSGQPSFVLKAANHEMIGQSEMYSSTTAMENGIRSVKDHAPLADTIDLT